MSETNIPPDRSHWLIIAMIALGVIIIIWYITVNEKNGLDILFAIIPMATIPFLIIWGFNKLTTIPDGQDEDRED